MKCRVHRRYTATYAPRLACRGCWYVYILAKLYRGDWEEFVDFD